MSYTFVSFLQCTLKLGNVTNLKALFHTMCQSRQIFPTCPCQKLKKKKHGKIYLTLLTVELPVAQ